MAYYVMLMARPFERHQTISTDLPVKFGMPDTAVLDAVVFGVLGFLSFFLVMNVMGYRGGFKKADIDVLFATPVSPKVVLVFRLIRDYLFTLLMPLFFAVVGWRAVNPSIGVLFKSFPESGPYAFKAMTVAWFLMALGWVSIGYATSLFVNRSDLESDRNRKILGYSIAFCLFGAATYIGWMIREAFIQSDGMSVQQCVALAHAPVLRAVFFTSTAATAFVMAPLTGNYLAGAIGVACLIAVVCVPMWLAMTQIGWLYDQAASRGFDATDLRNMRQRGDIYGLIAEQARRGKVKQGWLAKRLARVKMSGAAALVWKDLIIQARGAFWQWVVFLPTSIFVVAMPVFAMRSSDRPSSVYVFFAMQAMAAYMLSMGANNAVVEVLRRVDFIKPLPYNSTTIAFWEVLSKAFLPIIFSWVANIVALAIRPDLFVSVLACLLGVPTLVVLLVSTMFMVTVMFPDVEDPTQRGFRAMVTMLALALLGLPSLAVFAVLLVLHVPSLIAVVPYAIVNLGIAYAANLLSGNLYASYNPSE